MLVQDIWKKDKALEQTNQHTLNNMMSGGCLKKYKKGELIFREREEVNRLFFLAEGYVALYRTNKNDDRKVIFVYGKENMLNEAIVQDSVSSVTCLALSDVKVLTFSRDSFLMMMGSNFELTMAVMESLSTKLRRCYRQLGNTPNALPLERQLASKLWKLGRDFGQEDNGKIKIGFDLSITFLADMVGAKRETVSRTMSKLKERKIIDYEKNKIFIIDRDALQECGTN